MIKPQTLKDKIQLFTQGLALFAEYMNSRHGSRAVRKWHDWQEANPVVDEAVIDYYCNVMTKQPWLSD